MKIIPNASRSTAEADSRSQSAAAQDQTTPTQPVSATRPKSSEILDAATIEVLKLLAATHINPALDDVLKALIAVGIDRRDALRNVGLLAWFDPVRYLEMVHDEAIRSDCTEQQFDRMLGAFQAAIADWGREPR